MYWFYKTNLQNNTQCRQVIYAAGEPDKNSSFNSGLCMQATQPLFIPVIRYAKDFFICNSLMCADQFRLQ